VNIDTIIIEEKNNIDSTSVLILELFKEKDGEKNIFRSIRKELKKEHGIKLSIKDIKQTINNSTNQN
tara:strand:+ start:55 stop:255 length:201 start_codon:yes stop_codon:yes gene_type:complete